MVGLFAFRTTCRRHVGISDQCQVSVVASLPEFVVSLKCPIATDVRRAAVLAISAVAYRPGGISARAIMIENAESSKNEATWKFDSVA
jgi:hypothetical protein